MSLFMAYYSRVAILFISSMVILHNVADAQQDVLAAVSVVVMLTCYTCTAGDDVYALIAFIMSTTISACIWFYYNDLKD